MPHPLSEQLDVTALDVALARVHATDIREYVRTNYSLHGRFQGSVPRGTAPMNAGALSSIRELMKIADATRRALAQGDAAGARMMLLTISAVAGDLARTMEPKKGLHK